MRQKRVIRIGLLGLGTVGQGVWKHLLNSKHALELRLGAKLELVRAAVSDLNKPRCVQLKPSQLTLDPKEVVDDPNIDIVCELIGGTDPARELTLRAFEKGKVVVTANKALICEHGAELFEAARKANTYYYFEASVAGGVPIIKTLREGLVANRFPLIYGILNGTTNYILTRMEREGLPFERILAEARDLGYVEADESLDLDGWDAAHKAVILAYLAHGKWVKTSEMLVEGIRKITPQDITYARELGYKIKLLAIISRNFSTNLLSVRLYPALIHKSNLLSHVDNEYNGISLTGDVVGTTVLVGRGAGQDATSSAVISDIADAANALLGAPPPVISEEDTETYRKMAAGCKMATTADMVSRFYLRLRVQDKPGVLAEITRLLSDHSVSIATMIQHEETDNQTATLLFTTHQTTEEAMHATLRAFSKLPVIVDEPFLLRIFSPDV